MYIVIDTNSVNGDLVLEGPAIKKLISKATEQGYKICFPEVVIAEMEKHFRYFYPGKYFIHDKEIEYYRL